MKRIFRDYAYASGPRDGCWWDETSDSDARPQLFGETACDVAIVGGGFTGLSAALHLAKRGAQVAVLEAETCGWGASGRNGGFCCLGGSMRSDAALDRQFGQAARREWRATERVAVEMVEALIYDLSINVDRHSHGETCLAHRPGAFANFEADARSISENYGIEADVLPPSELASAGFSGPFHGALTIPIGFGLNPRKYLNGLLDACLKQGVAIYENSPAMNVTSGQVKTPKGVVRSKQVIVATNGYSSEDVPPWMAARYMPAQSTVIVTRPLSDEELKHQGWSSDQMAYDTRRLLHYFRLMPDRRFLFGMRGGLFSGPRAENAARTAVMRDFHSIFPAWSHVDVTHAWSGFVCLTKNRVPFVGTVPGMADVLAGFAFHGNGVAMGTFAGHLLAALASGEKPDHYPKVMASAVNRFPFGRFRRLIMPGVYAGFRLSDGLP